MRVGTGKDQGDVSGVGPADVVGRSPVVVVQADDLPIPPDDAGGGTLDDQPVANVRVHDGALSLDEALLPASRPEAVPTRRPRVPAAGAERPWPRCTKGPKLLTARVSTVGVTGADGPGGRSAVIIPKEESCSTERWETS